MVPWLAEGFWRVVEDETVEIEVGEGWNMMDKIMEADDKKEVENGMMKMKMGSWDLYVKLEDWPMTDGMSREWIYKEFGKVLCGHCRRSGMGGRLSVSRRATSV